MVHRLAAAFLLGAVVVALLAQTPARHAVDVGGYDAAYVQGFHDAERSSDSTSPPPYLAGSDGSARWSRDTSYLLFPQAGWPGRVVLRLRGWHTTAQQPTVTILLNGREVLGTFQASSAWQEYTFPITGGLWKPSDVVIELRAATTTLPGDDRSIGVLVDRAVYQVVPGGGRVPGRIVVPYPAQVAFGGLAGALLWLVLTHLPAVLAQHHRTSAHPLTSSLAAHPERWFLALLLPVGLLFLLLYRLQPPLYPYPLRRLLPALDMLLLAGIAIVALPALLVRYPRLPRLIALAGAALWCGVVLLAAQQHVTLSVPGVEKDFRVFATRTESLEAIWRADGFYNLGYPLLLWLVQPLSAHNPFLAARLVAAVSGVVLLLAGYWLAHTLLTGDGVHHPPHRAAVREAGALLALMLLACSPLVVQYALYVGSDMPFAALTTLALALLAAASSTPSRHRSLLIVAAGTAGGAAFLVRHLGMVLLPWGMLSCLLFGRVAARGQPGGWRHALLFAGGFLLAASPQLLLNTMQTGQPLYSNQAKNIWLAVYGDIDWGRWHEVPDTIGLTTLLLRDPLRFVGNWWGNVVGFIGSGAEDTSEFGRAVQLRLLAWPANWLAVLGVAVWGWRTLAPTRPLPRLPASLLLFLCLYVAAVCLAFILPRFFLPLVPIYAVAAVWLCSRLPLSRLVLVSIVLLVLLWGGSGSGVRHVLQQQPADEVAAVQVVQATLQPGERVLVRVPAEVPLAKYSAIAHRTVAWPHAPHPDDPDNPDNPDNPDDPHARAVLAWAASQGITYLLWDERLGTPPLPDPQAARVAGSGRYVLYHLQPNTGRDV